MSFCLNEVNLIGYFGSDPEAHAEDGDFATVSLATNKNWTDKKTGEAQTHTTWIPLLLNAHVAKFALDYLGKGSKVFVKGELRENKWKDENGQNHSRLQVKVISIIPCGEPESEGKPEEQEVKSEKPKYSSKGNFYKKKFRR